MKILIYSDLHCSYTSSIMPIYCKDSIYTTRLDMIIKTGKWIADIARVENVDYIVNGGDTYDSTKIRAEEVTAMSEFFSYFDENIPHIIIAGNHEILDVDAEFHSAKAFSHMNNVHVYDKPTKINDVISVLPYMKSTDVTNDILKSISNKFLISHIDIKGSHLRDTYIMDEGVAPELIAEYFNFVANGHLHTAEEISTTMNRIWNIGSVTSSSFVDNNNYIPSVCIYDTETNDIKRINNPHAILFRKVNMSSLNDLIMALDRLDKTYRYIIRVTCPYELRNDARNILSAKSDLLVTYRVVTTTSNNTVATHKITEISSKQDMKSEFLKFLNTNNDLINYPMDDYVSIVNSLEE